jgi:hypothetical protein
LAIFGTLLVRSVGGPRARQWRGAALGHDRAKLPFLTSCNATLIVLSQSKLMSRPMLPGESRTHLEWRQHRAARGRQSHWVCSLGNAFARSSWPEAFQPSSSIRCNVRNRNTSVGPEQNRRTEIPGEGLSPISANLRRLLPIRPRSAQDSSHFEISCLIC